jgi:hypothetical protein
MSPAISVQHERQASRSPSIRVRLGLCAVRRYASGYLLPGLFDRVLALGAGEICANHGGCCRELLDLGVTLRDVLA